MDAKKCDRCGAFYVPTNGGRALEIYEHSFPDDVVLDLCPKCHEDLLTFVANPDMVSVHFKYQEEEVFGVE